MLRHTAVAAYCSSKQLLLFNIVMAACGHLINMAPFRAGHASDYNGNWFGWIMKGDRPEMLCADDWQLTTGRSGFESLTQEQIDVSMISIAMCLPIHVIQHVFFHLSAWLAYCIAVSMYNAPGCDLYGGPRQEVYFTFRVANQGAHMRRRRTIKRDVLGSSLWDRNNLVSVTRLHDQSKVLSCVFRLIQHAFLFERMLYRIAVFVDNASVAKPNGNVYLQSTSIFYTFSKQK